MLQDLPSSSQVEYERVFNRNGMALPFFRGKQLDTTRKILEEGISKLEASHYAEKLHHSILTSNLACVVSSRGSSVRFKYA
ncbi:hypothetical protein NXS08_03200 [Gleimia sp. 6138-11-ORH1]|uniref:hypothetical protein n=1 Tax=Gleimia sp. 6138-11-ORH1 TaxID=2973937 RepID=UPI002167D3A3|nr:hypothetical protein [Gleimia sp. 6138-11-ORH1]MCS4484495.1 hypothetical protein [Gleimia sp. 6138-11-ORH1]